MSRFLIYTGITLALALGFSNLQAQQKLIFKVGYNTGMPVGSFKDVMGKNSFRGFLGELAYPVNERLKIGLGVSYNDYYEKHPRQLYQMDEGTVSAVLTNSIQTTPIMIKALYDLTNSSWIRPYGGLGAGFNLVSFTQYLGEFGQKKTGFKPAVGAEAGINIPFNKDTRAAGVNVGGHFNYLPFKYNDVNNLNNWGIHAAIYFPLR
jgi:opacity protein-like surface antigen